MQSLSNWMAADGGKLLAIGLNKARKSQRACWLSEWRPLRSMVINLGKLCTKVQGNAYQHANDKEVQGLPCISCPLPFSSFITTVDLTSFSLAPPFFLVNCFLMYCCRSSLSSFTATGVAAERERERERERHRGRGREKEWEGEREWEVERERGGGEREREGEREMVLNS